MDSPTQIAMTLGVPLIIYVGAEFVKRSTTIGQVRIDDRGKFTQQVQDALDKALARAERCEDARRRQDNRVAVLEYVIAQVAAESNILAGIAEDLARNLEEAGLTTEVRRLAFSATKLRQMARKPEEDEDEPPATRGIGSRE